MGKARRETITLEYKALPILSAGQPIGEDRIVKSLYSVMGHVDQGGDRIWPGAFAKTLAERADKIRVLWQHDTSEPPVGVPMAIREMPRVELPEEVLSRWPDASAALYGEVKLLDTPRGNEILAGIRAGAIRENSIGYDPITFDFESDPAGAFDTVRNLRECRLWDLSPVNWGMQEAAVNLKSAIPYKKMPCAPDSDAWDGAAQMAAASVDDLKAMCAWYDAEAPDVKGSYKLPHHMASGDHATVWRGVAAAMGALMGSMGGVDIPSGDRQAVYNHLAKHYGEFDKEPPDFKALEWFRLASAIPSPDALKAGRVLSAASLEKLKSALEALQALLTAAEPPDEDDPAKALTVHGLMARIAIAERELAA